MATVTEAPRSRLDLGPRARTAFAALFFLVQAGLIASASTRADRSFAFRMFDESSSMAAHASRQLADGRTLPIENGRWEARDCDGNPHRFAWAKMVRPRSDGAAAAPTRLDVVLPVPYGVDAAVAQTGAALRWVLAHIPDDCETRGLTVELTLRRNTRPPTHVHLEAKRP